MKPFLILRKLFMSLVVIHSISLLKLVIKPKLIRRRGICACPCRYEKAHNHTLLQLPRTAVNFAIGC